MIPVVVLEDAEQELQDAAEFYERATPGLGQEFLGEVGRGLEFISRTPEVGAPYPHGTRRFLLRRFHYAIIYRWSGEELLVIAVAHQRRKPGYWRSRA